MVKIEDTTEEVKRAITGKDYGILVEVSTRDTPIQTCIK